MGLAAVGTAAAVASAAAGIGSAVMSSSKQSGNVASNQQQVQNRLLNLNPQFDTSFANTTAAYQPYATTGQTGLTATSDLLGLNGQPAADAAMARYQQSPGYQFQFDQGVRATDAAQAANHMFRSGATGKALEEFGQGLAKTDFGTYYNRLAGLAGGGLTAAGGLATANQNYVANLAGNVGSMNTASTGAANAQNSIIGNTSQGIGNNLNTLFSNENFQKLFSSGTPAPGTAGGFNNGADLVNPDGSVVLPPTFQPAPAPVVT